MAGAATGSGRGKPDGDWPVWREFLARYVQEDGRVIDDRYETRYTSSECQAYALFFSLVANDRSRFDTILNWTRQHLAQGDMTARLPGWRWGRHDDGNWSLVEANSAADADQWFAYTLAEAARLWKEPEFGQSARALLQQIRLQETVELPGFGWMVLPAPLGFQVAPQTWRLNPSYLAVHQLRRFAQLDPGGPWETIAVNTPRMLAACARHGLAPDWVRYSPEAGWHGAADSPPEGGFDAIRVYLWAGLLDRSDPLRAALLRTLFGMRKLLAWGRSTPPLRALTDRASGEGEGPPAFSAALLPYLRALGAAKLEGIQRRRVGISAAVPGYYDFAMRLFGEAAVQGRYRFGRNGALHVGWQP